MPVSFMYYVVCFTNDRLIYRVVFCFSQQKRRLAVHSLLLLNALIRMIINLISDPPYFEDSSSQHLIFLLVLQCIGTVSEVFAVCLKRAKFAAVAELLVPFHRA